MSENKETVKRERAARSYIDGASHMRSQNTEGRRRVK